MASGEARIKKLPDEVVSKIAAGEVVVNPASVVKELIENAIDAGATNVEISIRRGGKSYIKVSDDGSGMSGEELQLAIQRYTTSKISSVEDLYNLTSFGFRGEALASIADVSRLVITTSNGVEAHKLEVLGGRIVRISPAYRERGTTVEVFDLFFNIPARRKFLSSEKVEARMIVETVERFIISKPSVGFLLRSEDEVLYNTKPTTLVERFKVVFPEVRGIIELGESTEFGRIDGVISTPEFLRKNRTGQMFFVNGRFVLDSLLNLSLERGYGELIEGNLSGGKPYGVVFLTLDPGMIDVNIHPQKLQVKFSDPQLVYNALTRVVRSALRHFRGFTVTLTGELEKGNQSEVSSRGRTWSESVSKRVELSSSSSLFPTKTVEKSDERVTLQPLFEEKRTEPIRDVIVVRERYAVFEDPDGLVILDFHAAHERIIFEKLRERTFERVRLLLPIEMELSQSLLQTATELKDELLNVGFEFTVDGGKLTLREIPSILNVTTAKEVLTEVLEEYRVPFAKPKSMYHALASKACKAAVKTGDRITRDEAIKLILEIREKNLHTCPHGRPIMMKLSFSELDRFFGR